MIIMDRCVWSEAAIVTKRFMSDEEAAISLVLNTLYIHLYNGRSYTIRGDA